MGTYKICSWYMYLVEHDLREIDCCMIWFRIACILWHRGMLECEAGGFGRKSPQFLCAKSSFWYESSVSTRYFIIYGPSKLSSVCKITGRTMDWSNVCGLQPELITYIFSEALTTPRSLLARSEWQYIFLFSESEKYTLCALFCSRIVATMLRWVVSQWHLSSPTKFNAGMA